MSDTHTLENHETITEQEKWLHTHTLRDSDQDTHTHTHTHDSKHNSGSECQNPRQLDRQTRQSMSDANRRLSAAQVMGRDGHALWGMHRDLLEGKGGLWRHRETKSLHRIQQSVKSYLATRRIWESQALPLPSCCARHRCD